MSIKLRLDDFCIRQFDDPNYVGTQVKYDKVKFMEKVNELLATATLVDGYAPFCKHIFIPNFVAGLKVGAVPITPENESKLKSGYRARTPQELPVLIRWFPRDGSVEIPDATVLDLILYSREQLVKEAEALGNKHTDEEYDWGLISVKGQLENFELPMTPMTMLRNALGREEGGSGVPLDKAKYNEAVEYWEKNASLV